ncbi:NADPH-dependent oxidoreductase [Clostridium akagii]|uniref:NADPH-dependent oxidoreductase n=1 Tax=Clostridium akagii TaxID=91623 RepID=UPI00047E6109|nr:NADPH-dependent oxidoreductase [Clostridium akagii]
MNNIIDSIKNHRSIRKYTNKDVSEEIINEILKSAQAMPSSINSQETSVIVIRDKKKKEKIAELTGGQSYIAEAPVFLVFVLDMYKTYLAGQKTGKKQIITESFEGLSAGVFDAGLAMGGAIVAAESLGLGIVPIGGVRLNPKEIIKLLELPEYTYPLVGLVVGYPTDTSKQKPRFPLKAFRHDETYNKDKMKGLIDGYDSAMEVYLKEIGREQEVNWSESTSNIYQYVYYPEVKPTLESQGFKIDK